MSEALHSWLSSYLIDIGEEYGGSLVSVPPHTKRKKVQLVEYLTRGEGDDRIWIKVSDKQYRMPVCLTKLALEEFGRLNQSRLTSHKTALITIKDFRLVLTRIPVGRGRKGMTAEPYLAFECDSFTIIGSVDEAEWGRPKEIHEERSIHEWIEGLRSHGGAGNVLKERKKAREEREAVKETNQPPLLQQARINVTKQTARKTAPSLIRRSSTGDTDASPMSEYRRSWKYVENKIADIVTLHIPSSEGSESTSSEEPQPSTSRNAHPPQAALPSPRISAASPVVKASPVERHDHVSPFSSPLTEWSSTPSPRLKIRSIATRSLSPSPSRDLDDKITTVKSESEQREPPRITSLPLSPAIIPATYPSSSAATPLVSIHPAITRKVPRPMHVLRTTGDHIVAPDSDISYSLSQSQSQSQSRSQPRSQRRPRGMYLHKSSSQISISHEVLVDDNEGEGEDEAGSNNESHNSLFSDSDSDVDMDEQRDEADPPQCDELHAASTSLTEDDSADAGTPPRPPSSPLVAAAVGVDDIPTEPPLPSPPPSIVSPLAPIAMDVDEESPIILEYVDEPIPTPPPSPKQPSEQHQLPSTPLKVNDEPNHENGNHDVVDPLPSLPSKHEHDPKEWLEPSYMRSKKRKLSEQTSATPTTLEKPSTSAAPLPSTLPKLGVLEAETAPEKPKPRHHRKTDARRDVVKIEEATQTSEPLTKLKGFELDIPKAIRADEQSKWCSWERLHRILLVTGRSRSPQ